MDGMNKLQRAKRAKSSYLHSLMWVMTETVRLSQAVRFSTQSEQSYRGPILLTDYFPARHDHVHP